MKYCYSSIRKCGACGCWQCTVTVYSGLDWNLDTL